MANGARKKLLSPSIPVAIGTVHISIFCTVHFTQYTYEIWFEYITFMQKEGKKHIPMLRCWWEGNNIKWCKSNFREIKIKNIFPLFNLLARFIVVVSLFLYRLSSSFSFSLTLTLRLYILLVSHFTNIVIIIIIRFFAPSLPWLVSIWTYRLVYRM